jgi:hypothetical protein
LKKGKKNWAKKGENGKTGEKGHGKGTKKGYCEKP